jgi:hypothetical protein
VANVTWIIDALRADGLVVTEYPECRNKATPGSFNPRAVMWHHDASAFGPSPSVPAMIADQGNSSTPPPLAQCWVDTAGGWTVCACGRCNHAGTGSGWGNIRADRGNEDAIGVETDHTTGEPWPEAQLHGLRAGTAAIMRHAGWNPDNALCGHKEYAPGRKPDPDGLDMGHERAEVRRMIEEGPMECRFGTTQDGRLVQVLNAVDKIAKDLAALTAKVDAITTEPLVGEGQITYRPRSST